MARPSPSTQAWREALAQLEALQALDDTARAGALAALATATPEVHAAVQALLAEPPASAATASPQRLAGAMRGFEALDLAGQQAGPYRFVRQLGQGGMGQVWLAERVDGRYQGRMAIKLLSQASHATWVERFRREGQILARLAHPHIARLLDAGSLPSGQPYLVLEFVDGERIDRWCDEHQLDLPARLRLFATVCDAVAHAHAALVVHRDLKPSNILVDRTGQVKLLDFGIAKLLEDGLAAAAETALTRDGGRALTPEYAAPEQLGGGAITTATDVYALGVLLHGLLAGGRPYGRAGLSAAQWAREITEAEAAPLGATATAEAAAARGTTLPRLRHALAGDLELIVAKALKKDASERYASVQALADDLRRHLAHQPVQAQPDALGYRTRKFMRRHRLQLAAAGVVLTSLVAGLAATTWQWQAARREAGRTRAALQVVTEVFNDLHPNRSGSAQVPMSQLLERGWKRAQQDLAHDPQLHGELARVLGLRLVQAGESDAGVQALEVALAHLRATARQASAEHLEVAVQLANAWSHRGRGEAALQLVDEAVEHARRPGLAATPDGVLALALRGSLLRTMGRTEAALAQLNQAVAQAHAVHGTQHAAIARIYTDLAELERDAGRWLSARATYDKAIAALPPGSAQEDSATRLNAAVLDVDLGRHAQALASLRELVPRMTQLFGEASPFTVRVRGWHAVALSHMHDHDAALREVAAALALARAGSEPDTPMYVQLTAARLHLRAGLPGPATALAEPALAHFAAPGRDGSAADRARALLGEAHLRQGTIAEGRRLLEAAVQGQRQLGADQAFFRLPALQRLALALDLSEGPAAAAPTYAEAVQLATERLPDGHPDRLRAQALQAYAHARARRDAASQAHLVQRLTAWDHKAEGRSNRPPDAVHAGRLPLDNAGGAHSALFELLNR